MNKVGYKTAIFLFLWVASVLVGAYANSQAVKAINPSATDSAFFWSIALSFLVSFLGLLTIWLLARQGRRPRNLGLFYLLFVALNVVFFGDRGTVSSVVFAVEFFRSVIEN